MIQREVSGIQIDDFFWKFQNFQIFFFNKIENIKFKGKTQLKNLKKNMKKEIENATMIQKVISRMQIQRIFENFQIFSILIFW